METISPRSKPLQVLKDALDRATKIVRSVTPNTDESCPSPPFKSFQDFEDTMDNGQSCKSIFEDLYDLRMNRDNENIRIIERDTTKDESFLFNKNNTTGNEVQQTSGNEVTISINSREKSNSYDASYNRSFICESIAEVSSEFNNSCNDTKLDQEFRNDETNNIEGTKSLETAQTFMIDQSGVDDRRKVKKTEAEDFNLMFLNDSSKNKNCKSCHHNALPRRRSLPAALNQLRSMNNSALGKLPIRRGVSTS